MRRHPPKRTREAFRRQGVIIFALIVAIVCCIIAIGAIVAVDFFSRDREKTTVTGHSDIFETSNSVVVTSEPSITSEVTEMSETIASDTTNPTTAETTAETTGQTIPTLPSYISGPDLTGYIVVLDPGHQEKPNREQEPLSPTMSGSKDKVSSGTSGVKTGRPEYEVNLEIGLLVREYLEHLGCVVYMTRTENDVNISNIERAEFALSYTPDAYIRLHCDGSTDANRKGISVFIADSGKLKGKLPEWADLLGEALSAATGTEYRGHNASSRYSGLNWATDIPSFLLEMGYMSNQEEDLLLSDSAYQLKICAGIADFVSQMPLNPDRPESQD